MRNILAIVVLILSGFLPACKKNDTTISTLHAENVTEQKNKFAKLLAIAVTDKSVRNFLKEEASKKFGYDFDLFYPMIKNKKLSNGYTFASFLNHISKENNLDVSLLNIEQNLPLLNILVPNFQKFSAESWDIENQIPVIGIRNKEDVKANIKMKAISPNGEIVQLDYFTEPEIPVIIVKDNESLLVESKRDNSFRVEESMRYIKAKYSPVFESDNFRYYYADESLYKTLQQQDQPRLEDIKENGRINPAGCSRAIFWENFDYSVQQAFDKNIYNPLCPENTATTRDYVYYGIDPTTGVNQGPLNYSYRETISSIRCEDIDTRSRFDDIGEGDILDFDFVVYTVDNDPIFPLKKRMSINKNYFFTTNSTNPTPIPIELTAYPNFPLEFAVWNFKRQGDAWKYAIFEYDPGSTFTESRSVSATLGTNFTIGDEKEGGKFGLSVTVSSSKTVTITYTNSSDDLGEAVSYWCDPVIKQKFTVPSGTTSICGLSMGRPLRTARLVGRSYDIGTGIIAITVEPRQAL